MSAPDRNVTYQIRPCFDGVVPTKRLVPGLEASSRPKAGTQGSCLERLFMPHTCRSQYPSGLAQLGGKRDPQRAQPEGQCIGAKSEIDKGVYS